MSKMRIVALGRSVFRHGRRLHDACWDAFLGVNTAGRSASVTKGNHLHSPDPTPYFLLTRICKRLRLRPDDVFVDIGCGAGRAIVFAARHRVKHVIGVEIVPELASIARKNALVARGRQAPVTIFCADATTFDYTSCTCVFLFNPFSASTLKRVLMALEEALLKNPRSVRIAYYNPAFSRAMDEARWLVEDSSLVLTSSYGHVVRFYRSADNMSSLV